MAAAAAGGAEGAAPAAAEEPGVLRSNWLGPQPEEELLKTGLLEASVAVVVEDDLLTFPRRANGTPLLMRQGFFERLLKGETSLQDCAAADASAAETDVKRLGLAQLLKIRCQSLEYVPTGAGQASKASFLANVDRCTMALLAERLLSQESKGLSEGHRALSIRHAVLIYGAYRALREAGTPAGSDWWLFSVAGSRRFLHLPSCRVETHPPAGLPVCCYRSHTSPNPRDPKRSRTFKWQVLLVQDALSWTEDPIAIEQRLRKGAKLTTAKTKAPPATGLAAGAGNKAAFGASSGARGGGQYQLFGDFDLDELFDDLDLDFGGGGGASGGGAEGGSPPRVTSPAGVGAAAAASGGAAGAGAGTGAGGASKGAPDDIDDFFDSLLADDVFEQTTPSSKPSSPTASASAAAAKLAASAQPPQIAPLPSSPSAAAGAPASPARAAAAPPAAASAAPVSPAVAAAAPAESAKQEPPTPAAVASTASGVAPAAAPQQPKSSPEASAAPAASVAPPAAAVPEAEAPAVEDPPRDAAEARLRAAVARFYQRRGIKDKLGNVERIARRYGGDGVVDLWASLGAKYNLPPPAAVSWLSNTLDPRTAVQWPKGEVPAGAQRALDGIAMPKDVFPEDPLAAPAFRISGVADELRACLEAGDVEAAGAVSFRHGCPDPALRPRLWRTLLDAGTGAVAAADGEDADALAQRRSAYKELRARMQQASASAEVTPSAPEAAETSEGTATASDAGAAAPATKSTEALRAEVEADARAAWKGEAFLVKPNVMDAVISVALTHAWRSTQFVRGSCEMAALLLYVMTCDGSVDLADAEADAYWYLSQLMAEVQDSIMDDVSLSLQAGRVHELLRTYDPPLADLLAQIGLSALPSLRIGTALFARAGFTIQDTVRIWDTLLSDPRRFGYSDYLLVSLLLVTRGELMQHQNLGNLAEALLATPRTVDVNKLLRTTYAVCAFERRCAEGTYPPRPAQNNADALQETFAVAQQKISSIWGRARVVGAEAWSVGRTAAKAKLEETVDYVAAEAPTWREQAREAAAAAVAATKAGAAAAAEAAEKTAASAAPLASKAFEAVEAARAGAAQAVAAGGVGDGKAPTSPQASSEKGSFAPPAREQPQPPAAGKASPSAGSGAGARSASTTVPAPALAPAPAPAPASAPEAPAPAGEAPPKLVVPQGAGAASGAGDGPPPLVDAAAAAGGAPPALVAAPTAAGAAAGGAADGGPPQLVEPPQLVQLPTS